MPEYNPNSWRGPYVPFRLPFEVSSAPENGVNDEPRISICFNRDYLPYLQGAMKALASELSFTGERDDVKAWVQQMMELLLVEPVDGCTVDVPLAIDWFFDVAFSHTAQGAEWDPLYYSPNSSQFWSAVDIRYMLSDDPNNVEFGTYFSFRKLSDSSLCGVNVFDWQAITFDSPGIILTEWEEMDGSSFSEFTYNFTLFRDYYEEGTLVPLKYIRFFTTGTTLLATVSGTGPNVGPL